MFSMGFSFPTLSFPNEYFPYICAQQNLTMSDIAAELAKLHTLTGADYSRQVERIARLGNFHPVEGESGIFSTGSEGEGDYGNLLNAARKAVTHGYKVYILPNPSKTQSPDFIFDRKGVYRIYELKTIQGSSSASNRLTDSTSQSNHVLLNMTTRYNGGLLAVQIRNYFEQNAHALEVLIFKGKISLSIKRNYAFRKDFVRKFRKEYGK